MTDRQRDRETETDRQTDRDRHNGAGRKIDRQKYRDKIDVINLVFQSPKRGRGIVFPNFTSQSTQCFEFVLNIFY